MVNNFEENWHSYIGGTYPGQVMSRGVELSARTFIEYSEEGILTGRYELYKADTTIRGTLTKFHHREFLKIRCRWEDKYGSGYLFMNFSDDLASFDGYRIKDGHRKTYNWKGSRAEVW